MKVTFNSPVSTPAPAGGGGSAFGWIAGILVLGALSWMAYNHFSEPSAKTEDAQAEVV